MSWAPVITNTNTGLILILLTVTADQEKSTFTLSLLIQVPREGTEHFKEQPAAQRNTINGTNVSENKHSSAPEERQMNSLDVIMRNGNHYAGVMIWKKGQFLIQIKHLS